MKAIINSTKALPSQAVASRSLHSDNRRW